MNNLIDQIKTISTGAVEAGKPCNVYTGEITSLTPLIVAISPKLSLSKQLIATGRVQGLIDSGGLTIGDKVALLRYQGGQNFLIIDGMDAAGLSNYSLPDNVLTTDEQTFNATEKNQIRANVDLTEWQIAKASVNVIAPEQYYGKMAEFSGQTAVGRKGCFRSTSVNNPFLITTFLYIGKQAFYECNFGTFKNAVINAYEIDSMAFNGCTLASVDITNMTNNFGYQMFQDSDIHTIILRPNRVINLMSVDTMKSTPMVAGTGLIYVPDSLLTDYKTATNWTTYASQIKGISEIP